MPPFVLVPAVAWTASFGLRYARGLPWGGRPEHVPGGEGRWS
jgi:hypothetical protein